MSKVNAPGLVRDPQLERARRLAGLPVEVHRLLRPAWWRRRGSLLRLSVGSILIGLAAGLVVRLTAVPLAGGLVLDVVAVPVFVWREWR